MRLAALLLLAATLSASTPQRGLQAPSEPGSFLIGLTGQSVTKPVGGVDIQVRRSLASIATWGWWKGAPLPDLKLSRARSDARGRFRIPVVKGPEYELLYAKHGFVGEPSLVYADRPFLGLLRPASAPAGIGDQTDARADLALPTLERRIRILDAGTRRPIVGAAVRMPWGRKTLGRSDARGICILRLNAQEAEQGLLVLAEGQRLTILPAQRHRPMPGIVVEDRPSRRSKPASDITPDRAPDSEVLPEILLPSGLSLSGRLVDAKGQARAGQILVLTTDVPEGQESIHADLAVWTRSDAEGKFCFAVLGAGWRYGLRTIDQEGTPVELAQGSLAKTDLVLPDQVSVASHAVEGRVLGPGGRPITAGRVHVLRLFDGEIRQYQILRDTPSFPIDDRGRYCIPGLAPYAHELCFVAKGLEPCVRVVPVPRVAKDSASAQARPTLRLDVVLHPGQRLRGQVVDSRGKPIAGALLRGMPWAKREMVPLVPKGDLSHPGRFVQGNVRVLTRTDGTFLLEQLRSHVPLRILCLKQGYATRNLRLAAKPNHNPLRVVMHRR